MTDTFKSGFAAIIGRPNAGKSTLLNTLTGEKIAIVSAKPQTTRNKILGVLTGDGFQAVFIDTPGIHKPKHKLGNYMMKAAETAAADVDCVLFIVEARDGSGIHPGDVEIAENLAKQKVPVILVINKIDALSVERAHVLKLIKGYAEAFGGILKISDFVPVSALKAVNTGELLDTVKKYLPQGPKYFPDDTLTDQPERQIVSEMVREKALRYLNDEIPHGVGVTVDSLKKRGNKDIVDITANIFCERETHKGIIIGKNGEMLKRIGAAARFDAERILGIPVNMQLWVKVKKDWRNSEFMLRSLGYDGRTV